MRRVVQLCPCGGEIINLTNSGLTCTKCDAIFEAVPQLFLVKQGRDESILEGSRAKETTQVINEHERKTSPRESDTVR